MDDERFTVILNTFKRRDLLKLAVAHYSTCPDVAQIRVVWSEQVPPPSLDKPNPNDDGGGGGDYFGPKPFMAGGSPQAHPIRTHTHNTPFFKCSAALL